MGKRPKKMRRKRKCEWPIKMRRGPASSVGKGTDMEVDAAGRRRVTDIGSAKYSTRVSSAGENVGGRAVRAAGDHEHAASAHEARARGSLRPRSFPFVANFLETALPTAPAGVSAHGNGSRND